MGRLELAAKVVRTARHEGQGRGQCQVLQGRDAGAAVRGRLGASKADKDSKGEAVRRLLLRSLCPRVAKQSLRRGVVRIAAGVFIP